MKKILFAAYVFAVCANVEAAVIIGNSVTGPYQNGTNFGTKAVDFSRDRTGFCSTTSKSRWGGTTVRAVCDDHANSDASGLPGSFIATIGISPTIAGFGATAAYTLTPASPLSLAANTTYWIQVAFPASGAPPAWDRTDPSNAPSSGLATFIGYEFNQGSGFAPSTTFNAIIVEGRSLAAAVPEPETYAMLVVGLGLLGFAARRKG